MSPLELSLYALTAVVALAVVARGLRGLEARARWTAVAGLALVVSALLVAWSPALDDLAGAVPAEREAREGFVSSDACRACHPSEYASWHGSYHRTMTQAATPAAVLGDFGGATLTARGRTYRLERRGEAFFVDMPDPRWEAADVERSAAEIANAPRVEARIVMTTGSHHLQAYWVPHPDGSGAYWQVPVMWDVRGGRWLPTQDSFLQPPSDELVVGAAWNTGCIDCHSVGGRPGVTADGGALDTRTAELGISCEACHGPARDHAAANRSPLRRYGRYLARGDKDADGRGPPDETVVNPARLDHRRASEVCGQCHSAAGTRDIPEWLTNGQAYRAGGELADTRDMLRWEAEPSDPRIRAWLEDQPGGLIGRFWRDGTVRVAGRELNGLAESPCFQRGEMSCLSCHSLHEYTDPADQLAPEMGGDAACLQCHADFAGRVREHTRHEPGTAGSACYDCHMPHTTYGLFGAMRAHRVDSPDVSTTVASGRPNACNLCHADRTLAWTAEHLGEWYGQPVPELDETERTVAAAVLWLLRGDAAQRAVVAWNVAQPGARGASGDFAMVPFLSNALKDEYSAVRYVAGEALRRFPGYSDLQYDYLAEPARRAAVAGQVVGHWERTHGASERRPELLRTPDGGPDLQAIDALLRARDHTLIWIIE